VRSMNSFPLGLRQLGAIGVILFIPFAFLVLTQISLSELVRTMVKKAF